MKPGKTGLTRLFDALGYSIKGIRACWRNEAAFRQEVLLFAVLFPCSFFVAKSIEQWLLLITPLFLLLIVELLNSAVENVVDRIGHELHDLSGRAKDMGSAAVLICLLMTATAWFTIGWKNFAAPQPDPPSTAAADPAAPAEECQGPPPAGPVACTMEWAPVCGCDGVTYGNACQARGAGILRFTPGECGGAAEK